MVPHTSVQSQDHLPRQIVTLHHPKRGFGNVAAPIDMPLEGDGAHSSDFVAIEADADDFIARLDFGCRIRCEQSTVPDVINLELLGKNSHDNSTVRKVFSSLEINELGFLSLLKICVSLSWMPFISVYEYLL